MSPAPLIQHLHGMLAGWLAVLLLGRGGLVEFAPTNPAGARIFNYCVSIGYPKQADWFWYAAIILSGPAGAFFGAWVRRSLKPFEPRLPDSSLPVAAGFVCLIAAFLFGFSLRYATGGAAAALTVLGLALPWFSRRWYGAAGSKNGWTIPAVSRKRMVSWTVIAVAAAFAWVYDPCIFTRNLDGVHEGVHLLQVQAALSGDVPGLDTRSAYGPLYTHSLIWWMRAFGLTVSAERSYFLAVQAAGTAIHLILLRIACGSATALGVGSWLMLTMTTASVIQYGWANALRTAIPLLGLFLLARGLVSGGRTRLVLSGALSAVSLMYSPEFGAAGILAGAVLAVLHRRGISRIGWWAGGFGAAFAVLAVVMFQGRAVDFLFRHARTEYILTRLEGHGARPLPPFPWFTTWDDLRGSLWQVEWTVRVWGPALICAFAGVWIAARRRPAHETSLFAALLAFAVIAQAPVVVRPLTQAATSAPPLVLLAAVMIDDALIAGRGRAARAVSILLVITGLILPFGSVRAWAERFKCGTAAGTRLMSPQTARLGRVSASPSLAKAAALLAKLARPGERVYCAAPYHTYLCFLADRPALPPFLLAQLSATREDRGLILEALEREKPSVALLGLLSIDVPYPEEHARELAYVRKHYRLSHRIDDLLIYTRKR